MSKRRSSWRQAEAHDPHATQSGQAKATERKKRRRAERLIQDQAEAQSLGITISELRILRARETAVMLLTRATQQAAAEKRRRKEQEERWYRGW